MLFWDPVLTALLLGSMIATVGVMRRSTAERNESEPVRATLAQQVVNERHGGLALIGHRANHTEMDRSSRNPSRPGERWKGSG